MAKPNPNRTIATHANFARRLAHEREQRGWSYARLAREMDDLGCGIDQSALGKIERGLREVKIDELDAIARAFGVDPGALLRPTDQIHAMSLRHAYDTWLEAERVYADNLRRIKEIERENADHRSRADEAFGVLELAVQTHPTQARRLLEQIVDRRADEGSDRVTQGLDRRFEQLVFPEAD